MGVCLSKGIMTGLLIEPMVAALQLAKAHECLRWLHVSLSRIKCMQKYVPSTNQYIRESCL